MCQLANILIEQVVCQEKGAVVFFKKDGEQRS